MHCLLVQILAILALPVLVVLDEAYIEFSEVPSKLHWVQQHSNLVVLRTFSKSAGGAAGGSGLGGVSLWGSWQVRVGWGQQVGQLAS